MSTKPESRLRSKIIKYLRTRGGRWVITHGSQYQEAGISDILGCLNGHFWALELKTPEKFRHPNYGLTPLQVEFLESIKRAGGIAFCICSLNQIKWLLDTRETIPISSITQSKLEKYI